MEGGKESDRERKREMMWVKGNMKYYSIYIFNYDLGQIFKGQNKTPWLLKVTITPYKCNQKNFCSGKIKGFFTLLYDKNNIF